MGQLIDNVIALRILSLLVTPFEKWDAFKYGIIDKDGKPLRKASSLRTMQEKDSWSMLHRLVSRLKRMIGVLPLGKSTMTSYAAAYLLVRECANTEPSNLEELFVDLYNHLIESPEDESLQEVFKLLEDGEAPVNTTAGVEAPVLPLKKIGYQKISKRAKKTLKLSEGIIYHDEDNNLFMEAFGSNLNFKLSKYSDHSGEKLVNVHVDKIDAGWKNERDFYIGPNGTENAIGNRYERFGQFLDTNPPAIEASEVSVDDRGWVMFGNGRHRFAYLRDQGMKVMPVAMGAESIDNAKRYGYIA